MRLGVPSAGWLCTLVALATSLAWGLLTPPIHVPDEIAHFAYVQYLAETGELPRNRPDGEISAEETAILGALGFYTVVGRPDSKPAWTRRADARVRATERAPGSRVGNGGALTAANNPPLYYLLQVVPYWLSPSRDLLDRLALMRVVSALLAAATVLLVFLFLRELVPASPWAWTVGALVAAWQPLFGFFGGGLNNDILLHLASAALFYAVALAFRRGLEPRTGLLLGGVVAAGLLTKLNFAGYLPAVALALLLLLWRARSAGRLRVALSGTAGFALAAGVPVAAYLVALRTVWARPVNDAVGSLAQTPGGSAYNVAEQLSYAWQLYLPRLPFMSPQFGDGLPLHDLWLTGLVGRFGWLDYGFPAWVYDLAGGLAFLGLVLLGVSLIRIRGALPGRWLEAAVYLVAAAGLLAVIAFAGYRARVDTEGMQFEQARYLLPLLPLYAGAVAIALRGLGPRWGPPAGAFVASLAFGHTLLAQLITLGRFYG